MSDDRTPLQVGQTLWYVPQDRFGKPYEVTVRKIGRKWATVQRDRWAEMRIDIRTLMADGAGSSSPGRCYIDREEWEDMQRRQRLWSLLRQAIDRKWTAPADLTEDRIRDAAMLLGLDLPSGETEG